MWELHVFKDEFISFSLSQIISAKTIHGLCIWVAGILHQIHNSSVHCAKEDVQCINTDDSKPGWIFLSVMPPHLLAWPHCCPAQSLFYQNPCSYHHAKNHQNYWRSDLRQREKKWSVVVAYINNCAIWPAIQNTKYIHTMQDMCRSMWSASKVMVGRTLWLGSCKWLRNAASEW